MFDVLWENIYIVSEYKFWKRDIIYCFCYDYDIVVYIGKLKSNIGIIKFFKVFNVV